MDSVGKIVLWHSSEMKMDQPKEVWSLQMAEEASARQAILAEQRHSAIVAISSVLGVDQALVSQAIGREERLYRVLSRNDFPLGKYAINEKLAKADEVARRLSEKIGCPSKDIGRILEENNFRFGSDGLQFIGNSPTLRSSEERVFATDTPRQPGEKREDIQALLGAALATCKDPQISQGLRGLTMTKIEDFQEPSSCSVARENNKNMSPMVRR